MDGYKNRRQRVTKTTLTGNQKNTLQLPPLVVAIQLSFLDPEGASRPFPKGFKVDVVYGKDLKTEAKEIDNELGNLIFTVSRADATKYEFIRLHFKSADKNHFICEKLGEANKTLTMGNITIADEKAKDGQRFFRVPPKWSFLTSDWTVTADEKIYNKAEKEKKFLLLEDKKPQDIGSKAAPIKAQLDPHWQFLKFEYFDRFYGHSDHNNKPISIPGITVEGFFKAQDKPDVRSNWTINVDDDEKKKLQCLPWILQAKEDGTPELKPDKDSLIQFKQPKDTYIISKSATERKLKTMVSPLEKEDAEALKPCANRLKYYDLPELWKSKKYWCRLSDEKEEKGFFEKIAEKKTEKGKPLIFSLDDVVLTDDQIAPLSLQQTDKMVIFYHEFLDPATDTNKRGTGGRSGAKYLKNGLYKPGPNKATIKEQVKEQEKLEKEARDKAVATKKKREEENARQAAEEKARKDGARSAEVKIAGDKAVSDLANDKVIQQGIKDVGDKAAAQATKQAVRAGKLNERLDVLKITPSEAGTKAENKQKAIEEKPLREAAEDKQRKIEERKVRKEALEKAKLARYPAKEMQAAGDRAVANLVNDKDAQERIKKAGNDAAANLDVQATDRISKAKKSAEAAALGFPYSDIFRDEDVPNYIFDYPHWSRLIICNGNMFDVFDKRTTSGDVIGARAGVRWVDATPTGVGIAAGSELNPRPEFTPVEDKHGESYFIVQPYFEQSFFSRTNVGHNSNRPTGAYDEWGSPVAIDNKIYKNARTDMVLLRTSNYKDTHEENVVFRFHRLSFNFTAQESLLNPTGVQPADIDDQRIKWTDTFVTTCADRWNGNDTVNDSRAWIIEDKTTDPKMRSQIVTFIQEVSEATSHFKVETIPESGTSSMNAKEGTGVLRKNAGASLGTGNFAAAHEIGHAGGQPDDYAPSVMGQTGFGSNHITGGPFIPDVNSMMKGNKQVRGRSFWHIAEWLRQMKHLKDTKFEIDHKNLKYKIPHYNHADRPGRNYTHWNVKAKINHKPSDPQYYDSFLYFVGKDEYSQNVLPQVDGILVVMLKIYVEFTEYTDTDDHKKHILNKLNQKITNALNNPRVFAQFSINNIDRGGTNTFDKCMLHFSPRFEVTSGKVEHLKIFIDAPSAGLPDLTWFYDNAGSWSGATTEMQMHTKLDNGTVKDDTTVTNMDGGTQGPQQQAKDFTEFSAEFTQNTTPRKLTFGFPNDPGNLGGLNPVVTRLENLVFKHFCAMVGLSTKNSDANYYGNADAYKDIVKACVNDNSVNPTMTR